MQHGYCTRWGGMCGGRAANFRGGFVRTVVKIEAKGTATIVVEWLARANRIAKRGKKVTEVGRFVRRIRSVDKTLKEFRRIWLTISSLRPPRIPGEWIFFEYNILGHTSSSWLTFTSGAPARKTFFGSPIIWGARNFSRILRWPSGVQRIRSHRWNSVHGFFRSGFAIPFRTRHYEREWCRRRENTSA